jgi:invasion protein IalB
MNQRWLDLLGSETQAGVTIRNRRQREIKIPLSLKGISEGIAAIGIR